MIDSSAKSQPGVYHRGLINTGHEDQCLRVNKDGVKGSFSLVKISIPRGRIHGNQNRKLNAFTAYLYPDSKDFDTLLKKFPITFTVCHPNSCSSQDLSWLIDYYFDHQVEYRVVNANRSIKPSATNLQKVSIALILSLVTLTIVSTIKFNLSESIPVGSRHFDFVSNFKCLIRKYETEDTISRPTDFINGWKAGYLFGAIFFHMILHIEPSNYTINSKISVYLLSFEGVPQFLSRITLETMCTNVCTTAIVAAVTVIPFIDKFGAKKRLLPLIAVIRYFRLIPIVAFAVMIVIISPLLTVKSSAIHHSYTSQDMCDRCSNYWWGEALFVNNFLPVDRLCFGVSWFLSSDFQLSLITFPLLLTLAKDWKKGAKLCLIYVIAGIVIEYFVLIFNHDFLIPQFHQEASYETLMVHHGWSTNYISAYALGITFGTLMIRDIRIPDELYEKHYISLYAVIFTFSSMFSTIDINDWTGNHHVTLLVASCLRTIASLGICAFCYALWMSKDHFVKRILTISPLFNTVARILLPSFMTHALVLTFMSSLIYSDPINFNWFRFLERGLLVFPVTIALGAFLHVFIEIPFMKIMKSVIISKKNVCK